MTLRWIAFLVIAVALGLAAPAARAQNQAQAPGRPAAPSVQTAKIGFVDVQRILARSVAGVAAREQLEKEKGTMQREMEAKRQELEKLRDELEKKGALMTADSRRDKQDLFERKRRDATRLADDFQKELDKKEQVLAQKVLHDVVGVVGRLGKERGYLMIVEHQRSGIIFASTEADLTDEIIRAYDQEAGPKGKK